MEGAARDLIDGELGLPFHRIALDEVPRSCLLYWLCETQVHSLAGGMHWRSRRGPHKQLERVLAVKNNTESVIFFLTVTVLSTS